MWSWVTADAEANHTHRCGTHRDHKTAHVCGVKFGTRTCGAVKLKELTMRKIIRFLRAISDQCNRGDHYACSRCSCTCHRKW